MYGGEVWPEKHFRSGYVSSGGDEATCDETIHLRVDKKRTTFASVCKWCKLLIYWMCCDVWDLYLSVFFFSFILLRLRPQFMREWSQWFPSSCPKWLCFLGKCVLWGWLSNSLAECQLPPIAGENLELCSNFISSQICSTMGSVKILF